MFKHRGKVEAGVAGQEQGTYTCSRCGTSLFNASTKFSVGSGFPSFWAHIGDNVRQQELTSYGRNRLQLLCRQCGQHLGHLFADNRTPTAVRYCINAAALSPKT
ncbi:peptide-methionine (R)-S-oxide reductase [Pontibacter qinzhouensis]|uniref:peptide-methionine (R)-S-oxide reductase n=1 Tax=Pontibacter qinzhouensis TaxID=2603253 RepID=A0A5C8KD40_9BACT|nr:peptide-methionine (R)-S-oxide reductase [Pontibacter qinzhouensis]TXK51341.1 peptide-methionine (R)-S-oxide reductase [Pontibacter qinzhouensis]